MSFPDIPTATGTTRLFLRVLPGLAPSLSFTVTSEGGGDTTRKLKLFLQTHTQQSFEMFAVEM